MKGINASPVESDFTGGFGPVLTDFSQRMDKDGEESHSSHALLS